MGAKQSHSNNKLWVGAWGSGGLPKRIDEEALWHFFEGHGVKVKAYSFKSNYCVVEFLDAEVSGGMRSDP